MTENQIKSVKIALGVTGILTAATLGTGFAMVCLDYINSPDFLSGIILGVGGASGLGSISYFGYRAAFFGSKNIDDTNPLFSPDVDLKIYGVN